MSSLVVVLILLRPVLAVTLASRRDDANKYCACDEVSINRRGFPGFIFGSASAAYQVQIMRTANEYQQCGITSRIHIKCVILVRCGEIHFAYKIKDHTNADVAVDSYHLYKEDVKILKDMGVDAYKFSISWARILPGGSMSNGVNPDGINYYNNLINELVANGIQPWVTVLHLDTPQALEDAYGGFLSSQIVSDFRDFVDILFREFGDRVKYWITINEPWGLSYLGYTRGVFAPARCSDWIGNDCLGGNSGTEPYNVTHNQLNAHAVAVKLYRDKYQEVQNGMIGITVNTFWFVPYDETPESLDAKDRAMDFMLGWVMDPITYGRYPESMITRVGDRLPKFTPEESDMLKGSFDFVGLNYYSANYALNIPRTDDGQDSYITDSGVIFTGKKNGIPIGEQGSSKSWYYIYPKGLRKTLQYIKQKYNDPLIYITENGLDEDRNDSIPMYEALKDYKRKDYIVDHLCCLREAIEEDGVNVKGYFAWSLTDNFEWISGYLVRFGLHYIDFQNKSLRRYPKYSAQWFRSILTEPQESTGISDH